VLSELLIAITNDNKLTVRKLAKEAGLSLRIVQAMRSYEQSLRNKSLSFVSQALKVIFNHDFLKTVVISLKLRF